MRLPLDGHWKGGIVSDLPDSSAYFQCQKCGECCKGYGGAFVSSREIERISRHLRIDSDEFVKQYCQWSGKRPHIKASDSGHCVFWDDVCTIHQVKPRMCKLWPFIESMIVDPTNWNILKSVCPGIRGSMGPQKLTECVRQALADYENEWGK